MNIYRQGDVLIIQVDELPDGGEPIARDNGNIVLAYGEVTGHRHAIADVNVQWIAAADSRYLVSDAPFTVRHEEHAPVAVPAGTFRVIRQREYTPEAIRNVAD